MVAEVDVGGAVDLRDEVEPEGEARGTVLATNVGTGLCGKKKRESTKQLKN